jgi:membrane protein YdbS with pleckstrin-like domain
MQNKPTKAEYTLTRSIVVASVLGVIAIILVMIYFITSSFLQQPIPIVIVFAVVFVLFYRNIFYAKRKARTKSKEQSKNKR